MTASTAGWTFRRVGAAPNSASFWTRMRDRRQRRPASPWRFLNDGGRPIHRLGDVHVPVQPIPSTRPIDISAYASANTRVRFISVDPLETGEYWSIDNVQVGWDCYLKTLFDAGDKIGASNSIAMSRAEWASGSGTYNAFAHEMYSTSEWGTVYESPVGHDTPPTRTMHVLVQRAVDHGLPEQHDGGHRREWGWRPY